MSQATLAPTLRSIFLVCGDLNKSREFYQGLGFQFLKEKSRSVVLCAGNQVELHLHGELQPQEEESFGVSWALGSSGLVQSFTVDNIDRLAAVTSSEQLLFGPALTPWGDRILLVKDPDGHRLEFREGRK